MNGGTWAICGVAAWPVLFYGRQFVLGFIDGVRKMNAHNKAVKEALEKGPEPPPSMHQAGGPAVDFRASDQANAMAKRVLAERARQTRSVYDSPMGWVMAAAKIGDPWPPKLGQLVYLTGQKLFARVASIAFVDAKQGDGPTMANVHFRAQVTIQGDDQTESNRVDLVKLIEKQAAERRSMQDLTIADEIPPMKPIATATKVDEVQSRGESDLRLALGIKEAAFEKFYRKRQADLDEAERLAREAIEHKEDRP